MDNGIEKKKGRAIAHVTASAITLALSLVAFALFAYMAVEFFMSIPLQGSGESMSEQLGIGLTIGFSIVFMIIFGIAQLILSAIGIPLLITVAKMREGSAGAFGKVGAVIASVMIFVAVAVFVIALIISR